MTIYTQPPLFDVEIAPRWADQDSLGHINHVQYFSYLEEARVHWLRSEEMLALGGFRLVIAAIALNYRQEWRHGRSLRARAWVTRVGNSSFSLRQALFSDDGEQLVAEGDATLVHVNEDHRPETISAAARAVLARSLIES